MEEINLEDLGRKLGIGDDIKYFVKYLENIFENNKFLSMLFRIYDKPIRNAKYILVYKELVRKESILRYK